MASEAFKHLKILIVEDDDDVRLMLKNMLLMMGVERVFEASYGDDAIQMLRSINDFADLIICDWNMPGTTGLEVLKTVRRLYPDIPFLMLTGRDDLASVTAARDEGVTAYIRKPFTSSEMEKKIRFMTSSSPA